MSGVFVDSNVVLYLLSADTFKADTAEALLCQGPVISVQVLNEVTSVCRRKLQLGWPETRELLAAVKASCQTVPLTLQTHERAVQLSQQHTLSFYDALIVAAALDSGAHTLWSEGMHDGALIEGLRIRNPFKAGLAPPP